MTRRKVFSPSLWSDDRLVELSVETRWTALGLLMYADGAGRAIANPALIRAAIWPADIGISIDDIDAHLVALADAGWLVLYPDPGRPGRTLLQLAEPAVENHPQPSALPAPRSIPNRYRADTEPIPRSAWQGEREESESASEWEWESESESGSGERSSESGGAKPPFHPPSPFCEQHPHGTTLKCRNCGTARLRADEYRRHYTETYGKPDQ